MGWNITLKLSLPVTVSMFVCCGVTAFADTSNANRQPTGKSKSIFAPHRLTGTALDGVVVYTSSRASGPAAGHTAGPTAGHIAPPPDLDPA